MLGVLPGEKERAPSGLALFETCLGWMGVVGSPNGLRRVIWPQKSREAVIGQLRHLGLPVEGGDATDLGDLTDRLKRYWDGEPVRFLDKLDLAGTTTFQQRVWRVTRTIPYGETRSYAWVAARLGSPKSARAVGQALGRNPLPIVIPCHRVIGSDGGLTGFGGGMAMKKYLLRLEAGCPTNCSLRS